MSNAKIIKSFPLRTVEFITEGHPEHQLVMVIKMNDRTSRSYGYKCSSLGYLTRGINQVLTFKADLPIVVEIVNDQEFYERADDLRSRGYAVYMDEKGISYIIIPEAKIKSFADLCIMGFIEIYKSTEPTVEINDAALFTAVKESFDKVLKSIPEFVPAKTIKQKPLTIEDRIWRNPDKSGVGCIFISIIIKVASIKAKYIGGMKRLVKDLNQNIETDNKLITMAFMGWDGVDDVVRLLNKNCLQCEAAPVDFYVIDISGCTGQRPPVYLTLDDQALVMTKYEGRNDKMLVKLKNN